MRSYLLMVLMVVAACDRVPAPSPDADAAMGSGRVVQGSERWLSGPDLRRRRHVGTRRGALPRRFDPPARDHLARYHPGIGIGTDLKTIESLNGTGFHLSGFTWDYSGTTASFNEGRLDTLWRSGEALGASVLLRLDPGGEGLDSLTNRVLWDRVFSSTDPALQQLNPRVYQMLVRPR